MIETKALLLDMDGTTANTVESTLQGFEFSLKKNLGGIITREKLIAVLGMPLEQCYETLASGHDNEVLCDDHRQFQNDHPELVNLFEGVIETITELKELGFKLAIVTSRSKESAHSILESHGLMPLMDLIITRDDTEKSKPNPEPLYLAAQRLGVEIDACLMVGDTDVDVLAGKNAGARTIAVTYGSHGKKIVENNPTYIAHKFSDVKSIVFREIGILKNHKRSLFE